MIPENTPSDIVDRVKNITDFRSTNGPVTYLGCPLYIGRQRIIYFTSMVDKIISWIKGWQIKILSYGGRISVLQSLPIHLLTAIITTLLPSSKLSAPLLISSRVGIMRRGNITGHHEKLLALHMKCLALQYKQWWIFRSKRTLWGDIVKAKYWQSLTWKDMMINKGEVENHIQWFINSGKCSFWWDWLGVGPLSNHNDYLPRLNKIVVSKFLNYGVWNEDKVRQHAPQHLIHKILNIQVST